jgi:hypothetical protein
MGTMEGRDIMCACSTVYELLIPSMLPAFEEDSKATQEYQLRSAQGWSDHLPQYLAPVSPGGGSFSKGLYRLSL